MQSTTQGQDLQILARSVEAIRESPLQRVLEVQSKRKSWNHSPTPAIFQANRLSTGRGLSVAVICAVPDIGE